MHCANTERTYKITFLIWGGETMSIKQMLERIEEECDNKDYELLQAEKQIEELEKRIAELEAQLTNAQDYAAELEAKVAELEEKE